MDVLHVGLGWDPTTDCPSKQPCGLPSRPDFAAPPAEERLEQQVRIADSNHSSSADAFCPPIERAMLLRALIVLCHAAAMGVNALVSMPHVTRTPPTMLMVPVDCDRFLCAGKEVSKYSGTGIRIHHRDPIVADCARQPGRISFSRKLVRTSTSRTASALAAGHFLRVAIEVSANQQHSTDRPAFPKRDLGGPDTHARLKK